MPFAVMSPDVTEPTPRRSPNCAPNETSVLYVVLSTSPIFCE